MSTKSPFLTTSEVTNELRITKRTLFRWIKLGRIRYLKPGRKYLFPRNDYFVHRAGANFTRENVLA